MTHESGTYDLEYTATKKGAPVGKHLVRIGTGVITGEGSAKPKKAGPKLNLQYHSEPELMVEVKPHGSRLDFQLQFEE